MKINIQKYFLYFVMYAVVGWLYEVLLEVVVYRWGFSNRGVLFGPYAVIYGFGALTFIFCLSRLIAYKKSKTFSIIKPLIIFILCALIATTIELVATYGLEFFTGSWPWQTYADYEYNFQARVALSPSIRFGLGGVVILYLVQPLFEKLVSKLNSNALTKIFYILASILTIDVVYTLFIK